MALYSFNLFFLGRAAWLMIFLYAYFIVKVLFEINFIKNIKVIIYIIMSFGVFSLLRFN